MTSHLERAGRCDFATSHATMSTMTATDYGPAHQRLRAWWAPIVATGTITCSAPHCLHPDRTIHPGQPWDLGHTTAIAHGGYGGPRTPQHADCNRSDGARISHEPGRRNTHPLAL